MSETPGDMQRQPILTPSLNRLMEFAATEAIARIPSAAGMTAAGMTQQIPEMEQRPSFTSVVEDAFIGIVPLLQRLFIISAIGGALLLSSLSLYGAFYWFVMPSPHAIEPLFFDYSGMVKHPAPVVCLIDENNNMATHDDSIKAGRNIENHHQLPQATADLFAKHVQWEAIHPDVLPHPIVKDQLLKSGKAYYLEIALDLPESEINRAAGIFGILVKLQSSNGSMLASSMRTTRLPHETSWITTVRKVLWLGPLLLGATHESRRVVVPSFRHLVESKGLPLRYVTVNIIMQHRSSTLELLEVIAGEVRLGEELNDFQALLKEWFFTCYMMGTLILCIIQLALWATCRCCWNLRRRRLEEERRRQQENEEPPCDLDMIGSQLSDDGEWEPINTTDNEGHVEDLDQLNAQSQPSQQEGQDGTLADGIDFLSGGSSNSDRRDSNQQFTGAEITTATAAAAGLESSTSQGEAETSSPPPTPSLRQEPSLGQTEQDTLSRHTSIDLSQKLPNKRKPFPQPRKTRACSI